MSQSPAKFDYSTRSKILGLLAEYSNTLKEMSDSTEKLQTRLFILTMLSFSILVVAVGAFSYGWLRLQSGGNWFFMLIAACCLLPVILFLRLYVSSQTKRRLIKRQSAIVSLKLEKIVQLASQIGEHGDLTPADKLEFELRLVEAEGALRYARSTGSPNL